MMKKGKIKAIAFGLMLMLSASFLVGCGDKKEQPKDSNEAKSKVEQIKKNGKIVLGTCADYPPYEYGRMKDGKMEYIGFDIEIAKEIAKDLGVELEINNMDFDSLVPSLKGGKIDFVISGMTPNPDRKKEVDFSKIYYKAVQNVIIRKADKDKYKSVDSLEKQSVGAQAGSIQADVVKEEMPKSKLVSLKKVNELVLSLKTKKIEAVVVEGPVAKAYVKQNPELMITDIKVGNPDDGSAIAIQKGKKDLVDLVNKTVDRLNKDNKINKFADEAAEEASKIK